MKVCGTTSEEDALLAVAMGADAIGFIFAPSPRQVSAKAVRQIVDRRTVVSLSAPSRCAISRRPRVPLPPATKIASLGA